MSSVTSETSNYNEENLSFGEPKINVKENLKIYEMQPLDEAMRTNHLCKLSPEYANFRSDNDKEIKALNQQDRNSVKYLHPEPGFVMMFSHKSRKIFINVSIESSALKVRNKLGSKEWTIPFIMSQPRDEVDETGISCTIYDIMFHPHTYQLSTINSQFRKAVEQAAMDAVETNFKLKLNRSDVMYPGIKYKGLSKKSVLFATITSSIEKELAKVKPKYKICHRSEMSLQDFKISPDACISTRPKELVIDINLPSIEKASEVKLDVKDDRLRLDGENYELDLKLPYFVNDQRGRAEFNKSSNVLSVVLPVVQLHKFSVNHDLVKNKVLDDRTSENVSSFTNNYRTIQSNNLPPYECSQHIDELVFIFKVQNVHPKSIIFEKSSTNRECFISFSSTNLKSVETVHSVSLKFKEEIGEFKIDTSSQNMVLRIYKNDKYYFLWEDFQIGVDSNQLYDCKFLSDKNLKDKLNKMESENATAMNNHFEVSVDHLSQDLLKLNLKKANIPTPIKEVEENATTYESEEFISNDIELNKSINESVVLVKPRKVRSMSESATDDFRIKPRGILKFPRRSLSRTMSESSDEVSYSLSSSYNDLHKSQSSPDIPEEGYSTEDADKRKKTVRFMDKVSENLYRSNSSILEQRKKNQRKLKNKKKSTLKRTNSDCGNSSCSEAEINGESTDKTSSKEELHVKNENNENISDETNSKKKKTKRGKRKGRKSKLKEFNDDSGVDSPFTVTELSASPDLYE